MPIHFMHKSVNFDELIALYAVSDVCLVSSTRDGMNLVSYEYIATQEKRHGVLVLSEFTGAAQSLNGSILVNPWNTEELAAAMQEAVTMSDEHRAINFSKLDKYVRKYTRYVVHFNNLAQCPSNQIFLVDVVLSGVNLLSLNCHGYPHMAKRSSSWDARL
jgi:trehalose-6-phosphate synthase